MALVKRVYADGNTVITAQNLNDIQDNVILNGVNIDSIFNDIGNVYDDTATYSVGDYCLYNGNLYRCIVDVAVTESFDPDKWEQVALANEIATPATTNPIMDGTADVGTSIKYAREDHIHPTDSSRASASDLTTLSGGFKAFTVTLASGSWSSNVQTVSNVNFLASGYAYIVSPASASFADYGNAQIYADDVTTDGSMIFHCSSAPSSNLTVNVARVVAS